MIPQAARPPRRPHQQSTATEASNAPSADTHPESHGSHSTRESHGASKYVRAMRDPDWRRKDGQSQDSELHRSESLGFDRAAHKRSSSRNTGTEGSHEVDDSDSSGSWDLMDLGLPDAATQKHQGDQARGRAWEQEMKGRQQLSRIYNFEPLAGFCQLVSPRELPNGWPMSLMEVRPVSNQQVVDQDQELKLLRIRGVDHQPFMGMHTIPKNLSDEQSEQFAAALHAAETTPRKVKRPSQIPIMAHDSILQTLVSGQHRSSAPNDTAVSDISRLKTDEDAIGGRQLTKGCRLPVRDTKGSDKFSKMIEKLQRGSRISHEEPHLPDSSFMKAHPRVSMQEPGQAHAINSEPRGSRLTNSSDSGYEYVDVSARSSASQKAANANFNPRAQEFLSFSGKKEEATDDDDRHSKFRRLVPINELFERNNENKHPREANKKRQSPSSDLDSLPSYDTHNMMFPPGNVIPYLALPPQGIPGQHAFGLNMFHNPGPFQPTALNAPQFPNFAMSAGTPGGFLPGPGPTNFLGLVNPGAGTMPMQAWGANPGLNAMSEHQTTGASHHSRPPPVPKPRKPDPGNQQAYEAWIEWRKANEPGYAMECKLRQQRRSQRNVTTAPDLKSEETPKLDTPKLDTPNEVAASA